MFKPIVSDPEHFDDYGDEDYEDDYDFIAPFNGNGNDAAATPKPQTKSKVSSFKTYRN